MRNAFIRCISRLDMVEKRISEPEDLPTKTSKPAEKAGGYEEVTECPRTVR